VLLHPALLLCMRVLTASATRVCSDTDGPFMSKLLSALPSNTSYANIGAAGAAGLQYPTTSASTLFNLMTDVFGAGAAGTSEYLVYNGSLTTPPCTEGIMWHLMAKPQPISAEQLNVFTSILAGQQNAGVGNSRGADNRLTQPLNGRTVTASFDPNPPAAESVAPKALASVVALVAAAAVALAF
jgi:hypothetical protein